MKKLSLLLLSVALCMALLAGCNQSPVKKRMEIQVDGITVPGMVVPSFWDFAAEVVQFPYLGAAIPDQDTAIEYTQVIFQGMNGGRLAKKYVPTALFFDEEQEVWITTFTKKGSDPETASGRRYRIAVRKADGEVLRIWWEK